METECTAGHAPVKTWSARKDSGVKKGGKTEKKESDE